MRRLVTWLTVVLAGTVIGLVGTGAPACACTCAPITEAEALAQADAVFVGTVVRRQEPRVFPRGSGHLVKATFAAHATYKGKVRRQQLVRTPLSSASCGLEVAVGDRYLIFANRSEGRLNASLCGGSRPLGARRLV